jgi:multiple sugar transport system permease protein
MNRRNGIHAGTVDSRSSVRLGGIPMHRGTPYLMVVPVMLFIIVFVFLPVVWSLVLSLQEYRLGFSSSKFIGLRNFAELLPAEKFLNAFVRTIVFTLVSSLLAIVAGLFLALQLSNNKKGDLFYQTLFFLPVTATLAAMAVVFRFMFHTELGVMNEVFTAIGLKRVSWLQTDAMAMAVVILVTVWSSFGYALILYLGGLANVPRTLIEAAMIDGAGPISRCRLIVLPLISPTTIFVFVVMTVRILESFDTVKVLTDGGPVLATQTLPHLLYQEGFMFFNTGTASALAVVFFLLSLGISRIQLLAEKWVHYQ